MINITNNNHFTILVFTAATKEAIMCATVVAGKTIKPEVITGLDLVATRLGHKPDTEFIENNSRSTISKLLVRHFCF
jgi:hypothetical protein